MARNNEDMLRWGDIKDALMQYHAEQTVSKYVTERECEIARSSIEGALYAVEDVPSADVVPRVAVLNDIERVKNHVVAYFGHQDSVATEWFVDFCDELKKRYIRSSQ